MTRFARSMPYDGERDTGMMVSYVAWRVEDNGGTVGECG